MGIVDKGVTYSYSVGFWGTLQHPEVLVVGVHPIEATKFLWLLHDRIEAGEAFRPGERYSEVCEGYDVTFLEIPSPHKPLNVAHKLYEGEFQALQLIFPDSEGRFPGEDGYKMDSQRIADGQWE